MLDTRAKKGEKRKTKFEATVLLHILYAWLTLSGSNSLPNSELCVFVKTAVLWC